MRPAAEPSPGQANSKPPGPYDALPVLAAAGLIAAGAAIALPALESVAALGVDAGDSIGSALGRGGAFVRTAANHYATEYRAAAGKVANVKFSDPEQLGKVLGAQSWTATEEFCRSAVVGAGLAGGAWAAEKMAGAVENAFARTRKHTP